MATAIPEFVGITPFGVYCNLCSVTLSVEKGILQHGRVSHPSIKFKNAAICRAIKDDIHRLRGVHSSDLCTFLKLPSKGEMLWFCSGCFTAFKKKSNFVRHLHSQNTTCTLEMGSRILCHQTVCGRFGPKSIPRQSLPLSNAIPTMVTGITTAASMSSMPFTQAERPPQELLSASGLPGGILSLKKVPAPLMKTQDEAATILAPFVRSDEDVRELCLLYLPLLQEDFEGMMREFLHFSERSPQEDPILIKWLETGRLWLSDFAACHIANVSANVRSRLAEFEQKELEQGVVGTRTFTLRRGIPRLMHELDSALRFFFNFPTTLFDAFKCQRVKNATPRSLIESALIPRILLVAAREESQDHSQLPVACRYALSRGFTVKGDNRLVMNECGWFASRISAVLHLLRAGVCCYLVTLAVTQPTNDLTAQEIHIVASVQNGRVTNLLSPYVKRLRDINDRKPPVKNNTVNANGDITSGHFTFAKSVWSTIIPRVLQLAKICFKEIYDGTDWEQFLIKPINVIDWTMMDVFVGRDCSSKFMKTLRLRNNMELCLAKLQAIGELCLFGLGCGAVRHEEVVRLKKSSCKWHNGYMYYWTESFKQGSIQGNKKPKLVEHRLSLTISKLFLLIRYSVHQYHDTTNADDLLPSFQGSSMLSLVRDLFDLDFQPSMLNVRHLFTSIGNIVMPENVNDLKNGVLVSASVLTEKSGHTQGTGRRSYGTWLENSAEMVYDLYHKSLGEVDLDTPVLDFVPYPERTLLDCLKELLGRKATFRSVQQQKMVTIASNTRIRHSYVGLPCGHGKSLSWLIPVVAALLSGRKVGLRIVILPYKFLLGHMVEQTISLVGLLRIRLKIECLESSEINADSIPSVLTDDELPSILFLSLDAAATMLRYHMGVLQKLAERGSIDYIYCDEIQQMLCESKFRNCYQDLRHLGRVGVPVMCLSGSLPECLAFPLMTYFTLMVPNQPHSIECIGGLDPIGDGFSLTVTMVTQLCTAVCGYVKSNPACVCHIICSGKADVFRIAELLSPACKLLVVTGDTPAAEQIECSKKWFSGEYRVLVSTVVALVGNENRFCKTIIIAGFLFNVSSVVQAIGRLRPGQRGQNACVCIFSLPLRLVDQHEAKKVGDEQFTSLCSMGVLDDTARDIFSKLFAPTGLQDFLLMEKGCYLEALSSLYGFSRPPCNRCTLCLKSIEEHRPLIEGTPSTVAKTARPLENPYIAVPLSTHATFTAKRNGEADNNPPEPPTESKRARRENDLCTAKTISTFKNQEEKRIRRSAESVFHELMYRCMVCGCVNCNGECFNWCYRCGDRYHNANVCSYDMNKLSKILPDKGVCFGCFDTMQRGIPMHKMQACPLRRRLKRILFVDRSKKGIAFDVYLRTLYSTEMSFLRMVASFADRVILGRLWLNPNRNCTRLELLQIPCDSSQAPLLPPDLVFQSSDISVEGTPRTTRYKTPLQARKEYQKLCQAKLSVHRQRKFVFGALYDKIFPGHFGIDPVKGDFELKVLLPSNRESLVKICLVAPDSGVDRSHLLSSAVELGRSLSGPGNARGSKVGDRGAMHAIGFKSATTKETYKCTDNVADKVRKLSSLMKHWMEDNMADVLQNIVTADKQLGVWKVLPTMPDGPGSRMMISVNLGNSAHYDVGDSSLSVALWFEEKPGQSQNWYFVLPNASYNGSSGVVVRLMHGLVIAWDGREIYHCTSVTDVGDGNKTYGCMWGSSRK